jgi:CBS domain containing-hemolysin-like protein
MQDLFLIVSLVMGVSFFCSLCEAVLYSVPRSYVELLASRGSRAGVLFTGMKENVERPIAAILTLDTLGDTFGSAFAGAAALAVFGPDWLLGFSGAFALGILFFCKVIPKTLGVRYSKALSRFLAWPLQLLQWLLVPMTLLSSWVTRGLGRDEGLEGISPEEIQMMARLGKRTGTIRGMEEAVIRNILALRNVRVRDIMTPRTVVFSLPRDLSLEEIKAASPMWPWPHSRVPVFHGDADHIVGMVQRREVLATLADDQPHRRLGDLMRPVHMVPDSLTADKALHDFIERREHLFVVVEEFGGMAGVVTLEDVFEEILGQEIVDETDVTEDLQRIAHQRRRRILGEKIH